MIPFKISGPKIIRPIMTKKILQNHIFFILAVFSCLLYQTNPAKANTHSVQTYRQSSTQLGQIITSSTLVWESFANDKRQLEYAIKGGDYFKDDVKIPIFVCRANEQGLYVSGYTEKREKNKYVCVVSQSSEVKIHHAFDLLVNKGHLGKVTWKPWRKFNAGPPVGAVAVAMGNSISDIIYVARHRNGQHHHQGNEVHGADFNLGRFDPFLGLGKIIVTEYKDERQHDNGEILIETEPFKYELRDIVIDKTKLDKKINRTGLGSATLSNPGQTDMMVETVISYNYEKTQYWGNHEGVARGLPTKVFDKEKGDNTKPDEINWGLRYSEMRVETSTVSTMLPGGTALNVTLRGNYTSMEAPYKAALIAFYEESEDTVKRQINAVVQKATLKDIGLDFSPIYWIENGTFIPTTTTTTTTTSTEATTTSTKEPSPLQVPVVHIASIGSSNSKSSSSSSSSSSESSSENSSDDKDSTQQQNAQKQLNNKDPNSSSSILFNKYHNSILAIILLISFINSLALLY